MKGWIGKTLQILVTAALLLFVFSQAGLFSPEGRRQLAALLVGASAWYLALSVIIEFVITYSCTLKWWLLLRSRGTFVSLLRLYAYYLIGLLYNLLLPTSMGGDVVRIYELRRHTGKGAEAVASVFVDRFTGMVTLALFSLAAVLINLRKFNLPLITYSLLFLAAGILVAGWLVLDSRPLHVLDRLLRRFVPSLAPHTAALHKIQLSVHHYRRDRGALAMAFGNSLVFYLLAVVNVWLAARVFSDEMTLSAAFVATPIIMLLMNLPVSVGGIGLMEFSYTFTFELLGLGSALGLAVALLMRVKSLMNAALGAACHPLLLKGRNLPREIAGQNANKTIAGTNT
jgi:uncharacterized protein (TIRG00374 family)